MAVLEHARGTAMQRDMHPVIQNVWRYGLKTLCGIASMHALPRLRFSDEALMPLVSWQGPVGRLRRVPAWGHRTAG